MHQGGFQCHIKERSEEMFSPKVFVLVSVLLVVQPGHGAEIIGGKEVKPHSMPFMALVENDSSICGGTLIRPKWVLTAAHCGQMIRVRLGGHSIRKKRSWQVFEVTQHVQHPAFDKKKKVNDLMLLKLKTEAKQSKTIKHLPLGSPVKEPRAGSSCLVAGWGQTDKAVKESSDVLMSVNVTVVDRAKCSKCYGKNPVITKEMICAGSTMADTCQGDSGGPFLCNGELVGVTSFGRGCADKCPGVYAYLSKEQINWIKKIVRTSETQD